MDMDAYYGAAAQLPAAISGALLRIAEKAAQSVTEIRLRSGRAITLSTAGGSLYITNDGALLQAPAHNLLITSHEMLSNCFHAVCGYSVHSFEASISNGFVPLPGGHRAGICGTALTDKNGAFTVKNITSINIRIARASFCRCDARIAALLDKTPVGLLLAGEPGSGKTTVLRGVAAALSEKGRRTAIVDERFEIAPVEQAGFSSAVPQHCDVLSGYPKHVGMQHALRCLAPDVILCDEVGSVDDVAAIRQAANAGVGMVATIHAADAETLLRRPQYTEMVRSGVFGAVAFLKGKAVPGEIAEVVDAAYFV